MPAEKSQVEPSNMSVNQKLRSENIGDTIKIK